VEKWKKEGNDNSDGIFIIEIKYALKFISRLCFYLRKVMGKQLKGAQENFISKKSKECVSKSFTTQIQIPSMSLNSAKNLTFQRIILGLVGMSS